MSNKQTYALVVYNAIAPLFFKKVDRLKESFLNILKKNNTPIYHKFYKCKNRIYTSAEFAFIQNNYEIYGACSNRVCIIRPELEKEFLVFVDNYKSFLTDYCIKTRFLKTTLSQINTIAEFNYLFNSYIQNKAKRQVHVAYKDSPDISDTIKQIKKDNKDILESINSLHIENLLI